MRCTAIFTTFSYYTNRKIPAVVFDLQLFNEEKTEEATPKRKEDTRKRGQVAKSIEINSAFVIIAAFFALNVLGKFIYNELINFMGKIFTTLAVPDLTISSFVVLFMNAGLVFLKVTMPIMLVIIVVSLAVNFAQVGFMFTLEPLIPDFNRLNPISGFGRLFSKRSLVELMKALAKVFIIGYFIYRFLLKEVYQMPKLMSTDLLDALGKVSSMTVELAYQVGIIMLVLAALDYLYQWYDHKESIKMSKQEVKEEMKQNEGDPQIKGKIKERQRAIAMKRMMQDVPKADVVVTNPTHFAVALKYKDDMPAPIVVAKGKDMIAARIKEIAREHDVTIVENRPLAQSLYKTTDIGDIIPPELYQAVAEVLAYVYRLKKKLS